MARSWSQLLGEENAQPEAEEQHGRFFSRLRDSLGKSRRALTEQIAATAWKSRLAAQGRSSLSDCPVSRQVMTAPGSAVGP
jgi:hypothetical protein